MMQKSATLALTLHLLIALLAWQDVAAGPVADAAERRDPDAVRDLLRSGADVNQAHGDGMTALHWTAENGDAELAGMLIYAGANIDAGTRINAYTPLHIASRHGHVAVVDKLLAAGADVRATTSNSDATPLHLASASPSAATVRALLAAGAEVEARENAWGQTPLVFAASAGRLENVRVLLDAGADYSVTSSVVDTREMERADQAANQRLVAALADFKEKAGGGPEWLPKPNEVQGAISFAREIQRNWPEVPDPACEVRDDPAANRFSRGSLPDRCNEDDAAAEPQQAKRLSYGEWVGHWGGLTPLLHAVRQGHADVVAALVDAGADIDQPSAGDQTTPLLMATVNGQFDIALYLIERGADPNRVSDAGTGPLFATLERQWAPWSHYAHPVDYQRQQASYLDVLRALLEAGAEPNARLEKHLWYAEFTTSVFVPAGLHYDGATPFWRAAQALDVRAMRLLKEFGADPNIPTRKIPPRSRGQRDPQQEEAKEVDHSGLPEVPVGGPYVYPIHAAAGAGYGQYFMAHAHRHVAENWLPAVRYLVEECGADVNLRDANGYTPLHHAAARGDNQMIEYLVSRGADVLVVSRKGQTTADMANGPAERISPFPEAIALLESLGAKNNHNCVSC
ncbi:MAG: ankyrin repeat domain-containing protein [Woeseiaceae bacterium]|nr:ankyrin repeat domain-containing protein [Woeseiaceae bacterium]